MPGQRGCVVNAAAASLRIALVGNPNCGKTALFNRLTGNRQKVANWLVAILYNREQLAEEGSPIDADWGVVGCLYTAEPEEIPMAPITMMRNALGVEEGGSSVAIDRDAYRRSVAFWESNANWR